MDQFPNRKQEKALANITQRRLIVNELVKFTGIGIDKTCKNVVYSVLMWREVVILMINLAISSMNSYLKLLIKKFS